MDRNSAKYAEPIGPVDVDEPRDGIYWLGVARSAALYLVGAVSLLLAMWFVISVGLQLDVLLASPGAIFIDPNAPDPSDLARERRQRRDDDALVDASIAGNAAGMLGCAAGLNPHPMKSALWHAWEHARRTANARQISKTLALRSCAGCTCGGRGICRDAA